MKKVTTAHAQFAYVGSVSFDHGPDWPQPLTATGV